jgi:hypothetical protein
MARDSETAQCVTSSHGLPAPTPPKVGRLGEYDIDVLVAWSATDFSSSEVTFIEHQTPLGQFLKTQTYALFAP